MLTWEAEARDAIDECVRQFAGLEAELAVAKAEVERLEREKNARVYYQGIVYAVCNALDRIDGKRPGEGIVCGTLETPSEDVQVRVEQLEGEAMLQAEVAAENKLLKAEVERLKAKLDELRQDYGGLPCACEFDDDGELIEPCKYHGDIGLQLERLEALLLAVKAMVPLGTELQRRIDAALTPKNKEGDDGTPKFERVEQ